MPQNRRDSGAVRSFKAALKQGASNDELHALAARIVGRRIDNMGGVYRSLGGRGGEVLRTFPNEVDLVSGPEGIMTRQEYEEVNNNESF